MEKKLPPIKNFFVWLLLSSIMVIPVIQAAPPPPVEGGFSLAVIPASQKYVELRPEFYTIQTGWIAASIERSLLRI